MGNPHKTADGFWTEGLPEIANDAALANELVDWFIQVFADQGEGEWAENWTAEEARQRLFLDFADQNDQSWVTFWRTGGQLAGAAIVVVGRADTVFRAEDLPSGSRTPETLATVNDHLDWLVGPDAMIAKYRELGIIRGFRQGLKPVARLIADSGAAAMRQGARYGCWFTNKPGRLFPIVAGLDCRVAYDFHDQRGYVMMIGECDQTVRRLRQAPRRIAAMIAARLKNLGLDK